MKKFTLLFAVAASAVMISCQKEVFNPIPQGENTPPASIQSAVASPGNGSQSGSHYTLNILGSKKAKSGNFDLSADNGRRIFVALGERTGTPTRTKIGLTPGEGFAVLDADGTDGEAAFQLPASVSGSYKVYARALGIPGGSATITTCADADLTDDGYIEVCSVVNMTTLNGGSALTAGPKPKFINVTDALLYITIGADTEINGVSFKAGDKISLFDEVLEGYFWAYDSNGLKLLQMRFYPMEQPKQEITQRRKPR